MNKRVIILLLVNCLFKTFLFAEKFNIIHDTIYLNISDYINKESKLHLTHSVKHKNHYYCFLYEQGYYSSQLQTRHFFKYSLSDSTLVKCDLPYDLKSSSYLDLFVKNDKVFAQGLYSKNSFQFDETTFEWIRKKKVDHEVYQDESFKVKYMHFGEWGNATWFKDKKSRKEYVVGKNGSTINRIGNKYFFTTPNQIIEITPKELNQSVFTDSYKFLSKAETYYKYRPSKKGVNILYNDTTYSIFDIDPKQRIITSFVLKNKLYQIYSDISSTYIGTLEDSELIPLLALDKKYNMLYRIPQCRRNMNKSDNYRYINFKDGYNTFGYIEIIDSTVKINHIIHDHDSLSYTDDDSFEMLLNQINDPLNLNIDTLTLFENEIGGTEMNQNHIETYGISYHPDSIQYDYKEFIKIMNKAITQTTKYKYDLNTGRVHHISFEWSETVPISLDSDKSIFFYNRFSSDELKKKFSEVIKTLDNVTMSSSVDISRKEDYTMCKWSDFDKYNITLHASTGMYYRRIEIFVLLK